MLPMDATVSTVIDPDSRWWNVPLIYSMFSKEEADCITVIHLSKYGQPDLQIWRGTSTGEFKVRSAYHFEKDSKEVDRGKVLIIRIPIHCGKLYRECMFQIQSKCFCGDLVTIFFPQKIICRSKVLS